MASFILYVYELPIFALLGGLSLFILALHINPVTKPVFLTLRRLSMWIYYLHMIIVFFVVTFIVPLFRFTLVEVFVIDAILTVIVAYFVDYCQCNVKYLAPLSLLIK